MQGKTVLITGANQGIGKVSAIALGKLGARLVIVCRNRQKGRAAVTEIQQSGVRDVELIVGDMGSQADIRRVAEEYKAKNERLDVLLLSVGVDMEGDLDVVVAITYVAVDPEDAV